MKYLTPSTDPAEGDPCFLDDRSGTAALSMFTVSFLDVDFVESAGQNPVPADPLVNTGPVVERRTVGGIDVVIRYSGDSEVALRATSKTSTVQWVLTFRSPPVDPVSLPITNNQIDTAAAGLVETLKVLDRGR